jgi:hypothetical protein
MTDIHIRIPDDLAEKIKAQAEENNRSVNTQIFELLEMKNVRAVISRCTTYIAKHKNRMEEDFRMGAEWALGEIEETLK